MSTYRILNLGAGVQSTTIALLMREGKLPIVDAAIFADTGEEPRAVYMHLDWLDEQLAGYFPILRRSAGKLGDDLIGAGTKRSPRVAAIPAFLSNPDRTRGLMRRQCTKEYKLEVIERCIRREILGMYPRQRIPNTVSIVQVIGLSADEPGRIARMRQRLAGNNQFQAEFPLWDMMWTRASCEAWLGTRVPHKVQRSACVFCPFHSDREWSEIKRDAVDWARAVEIDDALRRDGSPCNRNMRATMYVHRSCRPLRDIDFAVGEQAENLQQLPLGFGNDCHGLCGV